MRELMIYPIWNFRQLLPSPVKKFLRMLLDGARSLWRDRVWAVLPNFESVNRDRRQACIEDAKKAHTFFVFGKRHWIDAPFCVAYYPDSFYFREDDSIRKIFNLYINGNQENNSGDFFRFYSFILNLEYLAKKRIVGDFAELGVYKGNTAAILAHFADTMDRKLYLFDTFSGFTRKDLTGHDRDKDINFTDTDITSVKALIGHNDRCIYYPGFFPDSITEELKDTQFSFISLDCDLYKPTKAGLEFFYPRLSIGGMMFLHDYSSQCWDGCEKAIDEFVLSVGASLVMLPDKSGTAVLQKIM